MKKLFLLSVSLYGLQISAVSAPAQQYVHIDTSNWNYGKRFQSLPVLDPISAVITSRVALAEVQKIIDTHKNGVNVVTEGGYTPLGEAIAADRLDIVEALLAAGANPNIIVVNGNGQYKKERMSFLHQAINSTGKNSLRIAEALIKAGADVHYNSPDKQEFCVDMRQVNLQDAKHETEACGTVLDFAHKKSIHWRNIKNKRFVIEDINARRQRLDGHVLLLEKKIQLLEQHGAHHNDEYVYKSSKV